MPGSGSGQSGPGMADSMPRSSPRNADSRLMSSSIWVTCRRSRSAAGSQGQAPVSRTVSRSRISARRSPSRCAPRMNSKRSTSARP